MFSLTGENIFRGYFIEKSSIDAFVEEATLYFSSNCRREIRNTDCHQIANGCLSTA